MTFISIVTGTYNRIKYLKRMVSSVRWSVGFGIPYEIVIVDGGSTDGTLEWCKSQNDITLIEHGKLLGAVKAFNDGAYAAKGIYVILANDDIEFVDESILAAISFMQDNPTVGIGCFYQDRNNKPWHVDFMSSVRYGVQAHSYYGQVCIVPKWLGDKVGWWGDYLRTYGGDNELSCNVLEYGYSILPMPCACIHDTTPMDELRELNNIPDKNGNNPDTAKWLQKWRRDGMLGPVVREFPVEPNTINREYRILYAPIYERGYPHQKLTKRGLREALAKTSLVVEVDYVNKNPGYVYDVANHFHPDMFLLQIHSIGVEFDIQLLKELRKEHKNAIFVNWNGDYHPEHLYDSNYMEFLKLCHLCGFVTTEIDSIYSKEGISWFYWQIGYEESDAIPDSTTPKHPILFLGNGYSSKRIDLISNLRMKYGSALGLYGNWNPKLRANGSNLYDFDAGAKLYKNCYVTISDSQWPQATGFVSNRLFQAMSAGAFLLQQRFAGISELLGLIDGEHLVLWDDDRDLYEKIDYYIDHPDERKEIARNGMEFIRFYHSFDMRVQELFHKVRNLNAV